MFSLHHYFLALLTTARSPLSVLESVGSLVDFGMRPPWPLILTLEFLQLGLSLSISDLLFIFALSYRTSGPSLDTINMCQISPLWLAFGHAK